MNEKFIKKNIVLEEKNMGIRVSYGHVWGDKKNIMIF